MNDSAIIPSTDKCSNGTGITAVYNSTVEFLVPNVAYNITPVEPSASTTATVKSDATASFKMHFSGVGGLLSVIVGIGMWVIL